MPLTQTIDLFSTGYWRRHAEVEDALRAKGPVHRATLPNDVDVWVVTRYHDARAALADPRLSKDAARLSAVIQAQLAKAGRDTRLSGMFGPSVLFSDPPEHARKRDLLLRAFTPRRVAALRPRVEHLTTRLLDALPKGAEVDLIAEFAFPLPVTVICELLGVPVEDQEPFRHWVACLMQDLPEITNPASDAMAAYFTDLIGAKRAHPGDDLLSALTHASVDGDRLGEEEVLSAAFLLFVAGHETTTHLIGNSVHALLTEPTGWQTLAADPTVVPSAVEEVLRWDSPVRMATHRVTTVPVTFGGITVPAGEIVLVCLGSANRDPDRYRRADEFDPHRTERAHLGFGHGIHHCLGASLARMEGVIALTQLTSRFPHARLAGSPDSLERYRSAIMNGFAELPVTLLTTTDRDGAP